MFSRGHLGGVDHFFFQYCCKEMWFFWDERKSLRHHNLGGRTSWNHTALVFWMLVFVNKDGFESRNTGILLIWSINDDKLCFQATEKYDGFSTKLMFATSRNVDAYPMFTMGYLLGTWSATLLGIAKKCCRYCNMVIYHHNNHVGEGFRKYFQTT